MKSAVHENQLTKKEFALVYKVSTSLLAIRDMNEMLRRIFKEIKSVFEIEGASIALHDAEKKELYFIRTVEKNNGERLRRKGFIRFPDHLGVAGWVLKNNKVAVIPDVTKDERFYEGVDQKERFNTRSMICVPLRTRKGLIGVLYAINKFKGTFTLKEGRLLEILSGPTAIAVENAQLYGDLKLYASTLELENRRLLLELQDRFNLQGVIGSSLPMRRVFSLLEKVTDTATSVLIDGETGTGKELIARVIHYNGPRKDNAFIAENCGALSETLLESELFGHVKGAFTGALADKKGLFELADNGTIFLDEIGETTQAMQVKLLRVIQEGQVRPVGGTQTVDIDVRLIASTNRNLTEEVKKGNFREDLYYRICVFPITMPPLREKRSDIPLLASHFLHRFSKKMNKPEMRITPKALDLMTRFNWPGNVRELENEIERAITLAGTTSEICEEHLSEKIVTDATEPGFVPRIEGTLKEVTEQIERQMVIQALKSTNSSRTQAAKQLGITRQGLLNKIKRYGIAL